MYRNDFFLLKATKTTWRKPKFKKEIKLSWIMKNCFAG